jgi:excisionase family DNA binding protein
MSEEQYISIPELAKLLDISRVAVFKRVKSGKIKAIRIGRNYAIPQKYVAEILGKKLGEEQKRQIEDTVKQTVEEYGDVLKRLGKE